MLWGVDVLSPATHDLVRRKKRVLSTLDDTCHQAPRSVEFLALSSSLAVSTALCRHPIQLSFWPRGNSDLPQ